MMAVQKLTNHSNEKVKELFTPYRVIADHTRACTFLIADGVVPGNIGRNYITRMIIRRASRFGGKLGLNKPFLAEVAKSVVENYGEAYPELEINKQAIYDNLTREEIRFHRTVDSGINQLETYIEELLAKNSTTLDGERAFELYATHGLPVELTRDILEERGLDVDESGFKKAMDDHRIASGAGKAMGEMGGEDVVLFSDVMDKLISTGTISETGVLYDPYTCADREGVILGLFTNGSSVEKIEIGEEAEVLLPITPFYVESGGQVTDHGKIISLEGDNEFKVTEMRKPAPGVIVHVGKMTKGFFKLGQTVIAEVDVNRRQDIRRNHTATHLLHAELHKVIGKHALQAGSMVSPDRLRFDFNHPEAVTSGQLEQIEAGVNRDILNNFRLETKERPLQDAMKEGATALFGEKYGEIVRTVVIGDEEPISFELCGGTHVDQTGDIGLFLITNESSTAAGIRRIEAVTGRAAYALVQKRTKLLKQSASLMQTSPDELPSKIEMVLSEAEKQKKQTTLIKSQLAGFEFQKQLANLSQAAGGMIYGGIIHGADIETLRSLADQFKSKYPTGVAILATVIDEKPSIVVSVSDDLVKKGINAGEIAKVAAQVVGGSGGGRPNLAQAGGKDASLLGQAIETAKKLVSSKI